MQTPGMSYRVRNLRKEDLSEKYFTLLSTLTEAPYPGEEDVQKLFRYMKKNRKTYKTLVVVSPENEVVGSGSLLIEKKFIRSLGSVGHIEDIVVSEAHQGKGLGRLLINHLTEKAKASNCYKVILACSEENQKFYEKCGYTKKEVLMALYTAPN
ncbi:glucosamine-phosphate N-acetyltransferase [Nematocida major]|uniref:glucosamine-phosphate N-acetyltransferase n=1 Tax=Nematocida major TaxID=1912982 RepID=UPI0020083345|nr:glucosamine-phosphate N-acetyltransferase [Nematocida major]KAH9385511.1 glucosamine-phosphate N-acetyltransferase [Nematocida major]